ncbi:MAG: DUF4037 domain-containing protein [Ruminococcaceae bacterium]|nr:DUF4037 domain-containing protein [Oscillospiraceae bacterium]
MRVIDICRCFYEQEAKEIIARRFPNYVNKIAVGLAGSGSECFGFEDELSADHDLYAGFQLFLAEEDAEAIGFELSTLYDRLPREFMGLPTEHRSRMGDGKHGVKTIAGFYRPFTGTEGAPRDWRQWLSLPSWALAQAVNGEVFVDPYGEFSRIREEILYGMPEDVRKKKIAARAAMMAQSGQYNFNRCMKRGERGAAMLAAGEFVRSAAELFFLLNRRHMPYYKWCFRALRELPEGEGLEEKLVAILSGEGGLIEDTAGYFIARLRSEGLSDGSWDFLEPHAMEVQRRIENSEIRSLHLMEG